MSSSISRDLPSGLASLEQPAPASVSATSTAAKHASTGSGPTNLALLDSEEPQELPVGSQLGNYVILGCIGRGAMASVYRAEHALLNKQVALKVMAPALHASTEARQRFLREARAVAAIQHPNVISISDAGLFEGTPYLVMELLDGEDLEHHLQQQGPFSASELPALALPLVAALAAAHDAGVIHRDLKPGNIFLARSSGGEVVPKLLDFGISKFASPVGPPNLAVTAFDQLMGSPLYLPPEALQGSRELTARSDQYSLGVVLYECITGQAPFYRDDLVPLLNAICEGNCPPPRQLRPETPPELEQVILRAMSVDPRQRFAHICELGHALWALADAHTREVWSALAPPGGVGGASSSSPVLVAPEEPPPPPPSSVRQAAPRRRRQLGAWALFASGCALLGWALLRSLSSAEPHGAALAGQPLAQLERASQLEPAADDTAAGPSSAPFAPDPPSVTPVWLREPLALATGPVAPGLALRPPTGSAPPPKVAIAKAPASAQAQGPSASSPATSHKRRGAAKRAPEPESTRELTELFFPGAAAEKSPAARSERAAPTAPAPVPLLVNEAPLFD